jgi:hypothetical protein
MRLNEPLRSEPQMVITFDISDTSWTTDGGQGLASAGLLDSCAARKSHLQQ